jgi:hypothetical protein
MLATMASGDIGQLKARVCSHLSADVAGPIVDTPRANAIKGPVPA